MQIFTSKCTRNCVAAGLRPDLLGELQNNAASHPLAGFKG